MFIEQPAKKSASAGERTSHDQADQSITHIIEEAHAPTVSVHGTLVDVFGLGVLLMGKSGVGKSETALELIERGHRLVADDMWRSGVSATVCCRQRFPHYPASYRDPGVGILNIKDVYGIRSVRDRSGLIWLCHLKTGTAARVMTAWY
jgi:HPr kinase/phosphorylase